MSKDNRDFFKEKKDWSEIKDGYATSSGRYAPAALWGTEAVQHELAALSEIHFQKAKIIVSQRYL